MFVTWTVAKLHGLTLCTSPDVNCIVNILKQYIFFKKKIELYFVIAIVTTIISQELVANVNSL